MEQKTSLIEEAQIEMHARILRCPVGDNPEDCPLHEIRKWPLEERLAWLHQKNDEEIIALYTRHINCFEFKTQQRMPESD